MNTLRQVGSNLCWAAGVAKDTVVSRPWTYASDVVSVGAFAASAYYNGFSSLWTIASGVHALVNGILGEKEFKEISKEVVANVPCLTTSLFTSAVIRTASPDKFVLCHDYSGRKCYFESTWNDREQLLLHVLINTSAGLIELAKANASAKECAAFKKDMKGVIEFIKNNSVSQAAVSHSSKIAGLAFLAAAIYATYSANQYITLTAAAAIALSTKVIRQKAPATALTVAMLSLLAAGGALAGKDYCFKHPEEMWYINITKRFDRDLNFCWSELENTRRAILTWLAFSAIIDTKNNAAQEQAGRISVKKLDYIPIFSEKK